MNEPRERYRPVFWWILGALPGSVAGFFAGAGLFTWVLEPLFFSDADGLEDLAPAVASIFAALGIGAVGGAYVGGRTLMRWNRRRSMPSDPGLLWEGDARPRPEGGAGPSERS